MTCICGISVNEVLCFLQQKYNTLDEVSLLQLCESGFSEKAIEEAKDLLLSFCPSATCPTLRKGEGRKKRNLLDILKILRETDPKDIPRFAAINLSLLPPVTFDYIDVTSLLKNISTLRLEVDKLKVSCDNSECSIKTDIESLRTEVAELKATKTTVSKSEGANKADISTTRKTPVNSKKHASKSPLVAPTVISLPQSCSKTPGKAVDNPTKELLSSPSITNKAVAKPSKSFSEVVSVRASREKRKVIGTGTNLALRSSEKFIYICASRINLSLNTEDVKKHLTSSGIVTCTVFPLKTRSGEFNSFKVGLPITSIDRAFDSSIWPTGAVITEWTHHPKKLLESAITPSDYEQP